MAGFTSGPTSLLAVVSWSGTSDMNSSEVASLEPFNNLCMALAPTTLIATFSAAGSSMTFVAAGSLMTGELTSDLVDVLLDDIEMLAKIVLGPSACLLST